MALNFIWIAFFLIAFVIASIKLVFFGDTEIFKTSLMGFLMRLMPVNRFRLV